LGTYAIVPEKGLVLPTANLKKQRLGLAHFVRLTQPSHTANAKPAQAMLACFLIPPKCSSELGISPKSKNPP